LFICPQTSHCRKIVAMDGTFTKNAVQQCILIAVTIDADNHAIRLAWGIVESESEESWRMFLSNIKTAIPEINEPDITIMSDRGKGLKAADDELGQANRAYCTQHFKAKKTSDSQPPNRLEFLQLPKKMTSTVQSSTSYHKNPHVLQSIS
jgi:transposase-like protein